MGYSSGREFSLNRLDNLSDACEGLAEERLHLSLDVRELDGRELSREIDAAVVA
jgi:hypothetical protein